MFGWIGRKQDPLRMSTARPSEHDYFSEQHDHTLKLIASHLPAADQEALARTNRRTRATLENPTNYADIALQSLRKKWTAQEVEYAVSMHPLLYHPDDVSLGEYLRTLNAAVDFIYKKNSDEDGRPSYYLPVAGGPGYYSRVFRVIASVSLKRDRRREHTIYAQMQFATSHHGSEAICNDGRISSEFPNAVILGSLLPNIITSCENAADGTLVFGTNHVVDIYQLYEDAAKWDMNAAGHSLHAVANWVSKYVDEGDIHTASAILERVDAGVPDYVLIHVQQNDPFTRDALRAAYEKCDMRSPV